jgi:3-hydroxyisobutyrate dehydrogenase
MAAHLLAAGYELAVFNRTRQRAATLIEKDARWRDAPTDVVTDADIVFLMPGNPVDVRETVLDHGGILRTMKPGALLVDMTTSEPSLAVEIYEAAARRNVSALDAPVSGGDVGARNGTLVIMVGGDDAAFHRALPLFECLGRTVTHQGPAGAVQHTKMVNQIAIASGMIGMCEALLYAHRAGLDVDRVIGTIQDGTAGSWSLSNYRLVSRRGTSSPASRSITSSRT